MRKADLRAPSINVPIKRRQVGHVDHIRYRTLPLDEPDPRTVGEWDEVCLPVDAGRMRATLHLRGADVVVYVDWRSAFDRPRGVVYFDGPIYTRPWDEAIADGTAVMPWPAWLAMALAIERGPR